MAKAPFPPKKAGAKPNPFAGKKAAPFGKKGMVEGSPMEEAMDKRMGVKPAAKGKPKGKPFPFKK
jgi:hypothetical protein